MKNNLRLSAFLLPAIVLVLALTGCDSGSRKSIKEKPNIVLIVADDLGYGDLSCYGASKISTPVIDQLAAGGMKFTNGYVTSSLCSPSRYSIMTGRYSWRTRLEFGVLNNYEQPLIEPERATIASLLKNNGYYTACVGKWHLGLNWALNEKAPANPQEEVFNSTKNNLQQYIDFSKQVTGGPVERGFDYFFGMSGSNNMQPYVFIENDRVSQSPSKDQDKLYDFYANVQEAPDWDIKTVNQVLTRKAVDVVNNHFAKKSDQPLFLYFPTSAIHRPCVPTFTLGKSQAGLRGDIVLELDWTVNEIVKALKDNHAYENTLLIFTSDNGPRPGDPAVWIDHYKKEGYEEFLPYFDDYSPEYVNENGNMIWKNGWLTYGHSASGEFLGFKQDPFEGGIRVPLIVTWPGKVKPSTINRNAVCASDFFATFAELVGDAMKDGEAEDSYSFLSNILDVNASQVRNTLTLAGGGSGALILIKDEWKFIEAAKPGRWPETWYPDQVGDKSPRLFNLSDDVNEKNNLFELMPEKAFELANTIEQVRTNARSEAK